MTGPAVSQPADWAGRLEDLKTSICPHTALYGVGLVAGNPVAQAGQQKEYNHKEGAQHSGLALEVEDGEAFVFQALHP